MSFPLIISGTITDSTGAVATSATVYARNETTAETINETTDSNGQYVMDAANFSSGYLVGDSVTIYCNHASESAESTFTIVGGSQTVNLTLVVVENSGLINYCTVQQIWDQLGGVTSSDISASRVVDAVQRAESEINNFTESAFVSTTETQEINDFNRGNSWQSYEQLDGGLLRQGRADYFDVAFNDLFQLKKGPLISITTLEKNSAAAAESDSWTTMTAQSGSGGDYLIQNALTSEVRFLKNMPRNGARALRSTYVYGHSSVPKDVERLTVLITCKEVLLSVMNNSQFEGPDPISLEGVTLGKGISGSGDYLTTLNIEIKDLYEKIERFKFLLK